MRPVVVTKALTANSAVTIAAAQTPAGAGNLTLTASPVILDTQRRILITTVSDEHTKNYVIIGTNDSGASIKWSGALPNATTAAIPIDFKTVVSFYVDAATTGNVSVGTNTVGSTQWFRFDPHLTPPAISYALQLVSGTGNVSIEETYDEYLPAISPNGSNPAIAYAGNSPNPVAVPHPQLQSQAGSAQGSSEYAITGWRMTINSGTGTWTCTGTQAGLSGP